MIRDLATDYLRFMEMRLQLHRPIVPLLADALRRTGAARVVDLCAGGAGPVPTLQRALAAEGVDVPFLLTDRFPNLPAFREVTADSSGRLDYIADPVDARAVPVDLVGFRTLFNAFHHFHPTDTVAVLRDAAQAGQPIGVFEIPDRRLLLVVAFALLTPLAVMLATPFIRPFEWRRLLWTYLVPLVPLTCGWDGFVSHLRAYTPEEMKQLADTAGVADYCWEAGQAAMSPLPGRLTYLLGWPRPRPS